MKDREMNLLSGQTAIKKKNKDQKGMGVERIEAIIGADRARLKRN